MSPAGHRAVAALRREPVQVCVAAPPPSWTPDCGAFGVDQWLTAVGGSEGQWGRSALLQTGPEHSVDPRRRQFGSTEYFLCKHTMMSFLWSVQVMMSSQPEEPNTVLGIISCIIVVRWHVRSTSSLWTSCCETSCLFSLFQRITVITGFRKEPPSACLPARFVWLLPPLAFPSFHHNNLPIR